VLDYIDENISNNLTVDELADVANFSRFHFQRIFSILMNETLCQYIQRLRLEKAAQALLANPKRPVTNIALECGFSSSSTFARAFKEMYKISASGWRTKSTNCKIESTICETVSTFSNAYEISSSYINNVFFNQIWRIKMKENPLLQSEVRVEEVPEFTIAYVRHIGPYAGDVKLFEKLFKKLFNWAGPRGLLRFPGTKVLSIYHDDPAITDEQNLRVTIAISVNSDTPVEGEIGKMSIPAGKYGIGKFEISADQYAEAWKIMYGAWLPGSGYQPDDKHCYELMLNDPAAHPEHKHIIEIYLPVKPL
jgi:AraC family transcriptional regulator